MKSQVHWRGDHSNFPIVIEVNQGDVHCMSSKMCCEPNTVSSFEGFICDHLTPLSIIGEFTSRGAISIIIFLITTVMINFMCTYHFRFVFSEVFSQPW